MFLFIKINSLKYIFYAFTIFSGLFFLGTRAGLIGGGLSISFFLLIFIFSKAQAQNLYRKILYLVLIIGLLIYSVPFLFKTIYKYSHTIERYEALLEESPRAKLEFAGMKVISNRSFQENLLGEGTVPFGKKVESFYPSNTEYPYGKWVEQDIYDMIGSYGFILGSFILLYPLYYLFKAISFFIKDKSIETIFLIFSIVLFLAHSFLAGHALNSPSVAVFIASIFFSVDIYKNKNISIEKQMD